LLYNFNEMADIKQPQVFFYCTEQNNSPIESFMVEHKIWHIQKGYILFYEDGKAYRADAGQTILLRKNQLVKASLMDSENGEKFEMVKILLTRDFLNTLLLEDPNIAITNSDSFKEYNERFLVAKNDLMSGFFRIVKTLYQFRTEHPRSIKCQQNERDFFVTGNIMAWYKK